MAATLRCAWHNRASKKQNNQQHQRKRRNSVATTSPAINKQTGKHQRRDTAGDKSGIKP